MYIVIRHYSNEDISEFDTLSVINKAFVNLDDARKYAQKLADEERVDSARKVIKASIDALGLVFTDTTPLDVVGYEDADGFEVYHDLYAICEVNEEKKDKLYFFLIGVYERETVVENVSSDLETVRNEMLRLMADAMGHSEDYVLEECAEGLNDEAEYGEWSAWANDCGPQDGNCDWTIVPMLYKADGTVQEISPDEVEKFMQESEG